MRVRGVTALWVVLGSGFVAIAAIDRFLEGVAFCIYEWRFREHGI